MTRIHRRWLVNTLFILAAHPVHAQIRVNPTGVNVNAQGATTVFLTFGGLSTHVPAEAFWCGELVPAAPDIGFRCDESTLFGRLPIRYDQSRTSAGALTDIMSIPPSVARRAYEAATGGATSSFFYVRRFVSTAGGPDQYVAVTCRLAGGGARVPFSLLDVRVAFDVESPVLFLPSGQTPPPVSAQITYNGTGRLTGRWEVVLPGEELPEERDLLTEATLPQAERGTQRRYAELERFNVFLPPTGRFALPGPDPRRIPTAADGMYLLLLRIEATDDKEGDSSIGDAGAGEGVVHSGAVAGFPMPALRYLVGDGGSELASAAAAGTPDGLLPAETDALVPGQSVNFAWIEVPQAAFYRLEVETEEGESLQRALLPASQPLYRSPPWLAERARTALRWRVVALDARGAELSRGEWRRIRR